MSLGGAIPYKDWADLYRDKWTWDRVAKGTHTRANCIAACSWNLFVKDGIVWREEQNAIYRRPRTDVPDQNPRGCQKAAAIVSYAEPSRLKHPMARVNAAGQWQRQTG
jgi:nitrate reductase alpha subunit